MNKEIKVKDNMGNIYTNNMSGTNQKTIIEMHFCTSYTQVIVQDEKIVNGKKMYPTKNIIIPTKEPYFVDMMAVNNGELGEYVYE